MKAQNVRNLVALSARKAHLEAIRRIQTALVQEIGSAGVSHTLTDAWKTRLNNALNDLNVALGEAEHVIGEELFEEQFKCEEELKSNEIEFIMNYSWETHHDGETSTEARGSLRELKGVFNKVICEKYNDGTLTNVRIGATIGFDAVMDFLFESEE